PWQLANCGRAADLGMDGQGRNFGDGNVIGRGQESHATEDLRHARTSRRHLDPGAGARRGELQLAAASLDSATAEESQPMRRSHMAVQLPESFVKQNVLNASVLEISHN